MATDNDCDGAAIWRKNVSANDENQAIFLAM